MDNDRIGGMGVNYVNEYIWNVGFMKPDIRHHDNIPIWDGDIYVYSTEDDLNNNNFSYRVPTQVKSHHHLDGVFPQQAKFNIETKNLNNYLAEGGVVFFLVYVRKNEHQIYVEYLTKEKIKAILTGKENQGSITVRFNKITTDGSAFLKELYSLYLQRRFSTKSLRDFNPKDSLEIVFDVDRYGLANANEEEISKFLAANSVDLLFKQNDTDELYYPKEGRVTLSKVKEIVGSLKFGVFSFTTHYRIINVPNGYLYSLEDGWLTLFKKYEENRFIPISVNSHYKTYREAIHDAHIVKALFNANTISINDEILQLIPFDRTNESYKALMRGVDFWFKLERLCEAIHIYHDFDVSNFSDSDIKKIEMLYAAYIEKKEVTSSILENHITSTVFGEVRVISYVQLTNGNKGRLLDVSDQMVVAYVNHEAPQKKLLATFFTAAFSYDDIPSNIQFDNINAAYTDAFKQNPYLVERANIDLLNLINHYDKKGYPELLNAAEKLSAWILDNCDNDSIHIHKINAFQIKLRMGDDLSKIDIEWITVRYDETSSLLEKFCYAILLKEHYRATLIYAKLPESDKNTLNEWPIYTLYKNLIKQHNG